MIATYPFTEKEMQSAYEEWFCNCGPSALAFALGKKPNDVRHAIPGFDEKRYTSPTMMKAALANLGRTYSPIKQPTIAAMFADCMALTRIQFTGPWTAPGANPRWAYRQSHWIASWVDKSEFTKRDGTVLKERLVFDCNGGIRAFDLWEAEIIPLLTSNIPRADGDWFPTHVWRLT